mmetsp:Transcript_28468/g.50852  ORF Transcript_28468/g.50852 Transcript_28468/m.50852 type:complete len:340 (-) Transcript_28468:188-1207(-)
MASPMLRLDSSRSCRNECTRPSTLASACPTLTTQTVPCSGATVTLYSEPFRSTISPGGCPSSAALLTSSRPTAPESPLRSAAPKPSGPCRSSSSIRTLFAETFSGIITGTSPLTTAARPPLACEPSGCCDPPPSLCVSVWLACLIISEAVAFVTPTAAAAALRAPADFFFPPSGGFSPFFESLSGTFVWGDVDDFATSFATSLSSSESDRSMTGSFFAATRPGRPEEGSAAATALAIGTSSSLSDIRLMTSGAAFFGAVNFANHSGSGLSESELPDLAPPLPPFVCALAPLLETGKGDRPSSESDMPALTPLPHPAPRLPAVCDPFRRPQRVLDVVQPE